MDVCPIFRKNRLNSPAAKTGGEFIDPADKQTIDQTQLGRIFARLSRTGW